jgi:hypothetical protein
MPNDPPNMIRDGLIRQPLRPLIRLNHDENIVDTHGENEEGDDFNDNQSGFDAKVTKDPDGGGDGAKDDQDPNKTQGNLTVHLKV